MLKPQIVTVLGLMSGTSLDGVDGAVLQTDGDVIHSFGPVSYRPYTDSERVVLRAALGRWPGEAGVEAAAEVIETAHAEMVARFKGLQMVGFHGQTLAHDPRGQGTHQAGSGGVLALASGVPVVWDFRSSDVALGGQGAPLVPFYHFALARHIGASAPVVFLNLGGVGNLTWVDPSALRPEDAGALLAFDTGPANAPMDDFCLSRLGTARDEGGALAATGVVDQAVVDAFLGEGFFLRRPPKSLDRAFAGLDARVAHLSDADGLATLAECVAASVAAGLVHCPEPPAQVFVCGGGRHNAHLMTRLRAHLHCPVHPVEDVGLDGDMLEAQAFAYLAVRVARGLPTSCPGTTGVAAAVGGGQISAP
jgi:anhydro-N-acetylmuramic acid kinase